RPGATCTCTSTARASMPSNATVVTRWTIVRPCVLPRVVAEVVDDGWWVHMNKATDGGYPRQGAGIGYLPLGLWDQRIEDLAWVEFGGSFRTSRRCGDSCPEVGRLPSLAGLRS